MTYSKNIYQNINNFLKFVDLQIFIITGTRSVKYSPTRSELSETYGSELFFTDSVGAVWLFSDGTNPIKVKEWK